MYADQIIGILRAKPGLSDREITYSLLGIGKPQQAINQVCRKLERDGLIDRRRRADGILGNSIAEDSPRRVFETSAPPKKSDFVSRPSISEQLCKRVRELGQQWAEFSGRPRLTGAIRRHWDALIDAWAADPTMPLAVRKMGAARGAVIVHERSQRQIVLADNSPAQWAFSCALRGFEYSLDELKSQLEANSIPFVFATKRTEKCEMKFTATLASCGVNLNSYGWKLCHIAPVGLKSRTPVQALPIEQLEDHFMLLLKPSNHFLVPKRWSGLGELPEVIDEVRRYETQH